MHTFKKKAKLIYVNLKFCKLVFALFILGLRKLRKRVEKIASRKLEKKTRKLVK